jgi:hypothetical protein
VVIKKDLKRIEDTLDQLAKKPSAIVTANPPSTQTSGGGGGGARGGAAPATGRTPSAPNPC